MEFVIITGMSGSGKSCAINALEDIGFYCIDNMPPMLMPKFAELCKDNEAINKVAFVIDIRGRSLFFEINENINSVRKLGFNVKVLFMNAASDVIQHRYKETRRKHPLDEMCGGDIKLAIEKEEEFLSQIKTVSDYVVDTTNMNTSALKSSVLNIFMENISDSMLINCVSFGFKYGVPPETDLLFDVRFLSNPFYVPQLKIKTGLDKEVRDFIMNDNASHELLKRLKNLTDFLVPEYIKEGKTQLTIAFGCTGGKHRSVVFAEMFYGYFSEQGLKVRVLHRDITK